MARKIILRYALPMASTLLLDRGPWDLCVDALGNIALATEPYSTAQDVASACRLFTGELYYGPPEKGVPFFTEALGRPVPTQVLKAQLVAAAMTVPGVKSARVFLTANAGRGIGGQVQFTTDAGTFVATL